MTNYRLAESKDLNEISLIHMEAFPDYFLTAFGKELLYKFYESYLNNKQVFVVAEKENKVVGFILGNNSDISRKEFFNKNFYQIIFKIIFELLKGNKVLWKGIFQRLFFIKEAIFYKVNKKVKNQTNQNNSYDLLSIALIKNERGQNIAFELEQYFCYQLKQSQIAVVELAVKRENEEAQKFYKKCNYQYNKQEDNLVFYKKDLF